MVSSKEEKVSRKISKSFEVVVHSCSTDKMPWKFQKIPRKMCLQELRPATEAYLELSRTSKMEIFGENS